MSDKIAPSIESFVQKRTSIMKAVLVYGMIWQLSWIISYSTDSGRTLGHWFPAFWLMEMIGWLGWMIGLMRMTSFGKEVQQYPEIASAIEDEFYKSARLKAFSWACSAALICQALLIGAATFHPFSAAIGASITIFVVTTVAIGSFLALERG